MADISPQGIPELGRLMQAYPQAESTMNLQGAQAQQAQAGAGLEQAQTGLVGMQTRRAAYDIQLIQNAIEASKGLSERNERGSSQIDPTETGIASYLNDKYTVDPMGDPKIWQASTAFSAAGNSAAASQLDKLNEAIVNSKKVANSKDANDVFQTSLKLMDSDNPLQSLLSLRPGSTLNNIGRVIASNPNMTVEEKNEAAARAIKTAAEHSHQYTGRELTQAGDQWVDKLTGFKVPTPTIGLTPGEKLKANQFEHTPQTVTAGNRPTTIFPDLSAPPNASVPAASGNSPGTGLPGTQTGQPPLPGFTQEQSDFIRNRPPGFETIPGASGLNADDTKAREIYRRQAEKLSDTSNVTAARANDSLTQIKRINQLLQAPNLTLGPGSHEYSQFRTVLENWTGTPGGQAAAYQILSKVLNASEMNDLLQQFHNEGAQVRLGAYESRLIMEKLAANPALTKTAIQQMLKWQASDNQYALDKSKVGRALVQSGKEIANFDQEYGQEFPKKDIVDSTLSVINPQSAKFSYEKVHGKTYTRAEVTEAAKKLKVPVDMFQHQLETNGAIIQ